jgi:hypothetical protein
VIVNPRRCNIGVSKPFPHLGDISLVIERIRGGGRAQRMRADLKPERGRVGAHQLVNTIGRNRPVQLAGAIICGPAGTARRFRRRSARPPRGSHG